MLSIIQSAMLQLISLSQSTSTLNVDLSSTMPNNNVSVAWQFSWQLASLVALTTFAIITLYKKTYPQDVIKTGFAFNKTQSH